MTTLARLALLFAIAGPLSGCSSELGDFEPIGVESGDLCTRACERKLDEGCVADVATCISTCITARGAGYCTGELDRNLACVAAADVLRCGRAPNGGSCDEESLALERCISSHHAFDEPPDCWGKECYQRCGPIGVEICAPGQSHVCQCPSGASGSQKCSLDGCFWSPCECGE